MRTWSGKNRMLVRTSSGEIAFLEFREHGPLLVSESGDASSMGKNPVSVAHSLIVGRSGKTQVKSLNQEVQVLVTPLLMTKKPYASGMGQIPDPSYPESSHGWYGRMVGGEAEFLYTVQDILGDSRYWLTISDMRSGVIHESHPIRQYELGALSLLEDWESDNARYSALESETREKSRGSALAILEEDTASWSQISKLVTDVSIPNLRLGETMRDTIEQLVPYSFPPETREELMAFLAWTTRPTIPKDDPVDFFEQLKATPMLRGLLMGHLQCIIDGIDTPPYVRLMMMADKGLLGQPKKPPPDYEEKAKWFIFWYKLDELFPDWRGKATKFSSELQKSGRIAMGLPIGRSAAKKSRKAWEDRFAMMVSGLFLRANVHVRAIGLRRLAYIGAAHRWPHNHIAWATRLGGTFEQPQHLQIMIMPPTATERVRRIRPNVIDIDWSAVVTNLDLFNETTNLWESTMQDILDSVSGEVTMRKLGKHQGKWKGKGSRILARDEAKVLDIASGGFYLSEVERQEHFDYWGFTKEKARSVLSKLAKEGIIQVSYFIWEVNLGSLLTFAQGASGNIYSLTDAFLRNTPSSLAMLGKDGKDAIFLSRLPEEQMHELMSTLPQAALDNDMLVRCWRPRSYRSYMSNLYQRLLKPDGIWDDDVHALLSQARSARKTVEEQV
ncbi:MAG: hypothetical protein ACFFAY_03915 [Promethearchaeota archaeon]